MTGKSWLEWHYEDGSPCIVCPFCGVKRDKIYRRCPICPSCGNLIVVGEENEQL